MESNTEHSSSLVVDFVRKYGKELWKAAHCLLNAASVYNVAADFDTARDALAAKMLQMGLKLPKDASEAKEMIKETAVELARTCELKQTAKARIAHKLYKLDLALLAQYAITSKAAELLALPTELQYRSFLGVNIPTIFAEMLLALASKDTLINIEITNSIIKSIPSDMFQRLTAAD